jgi:hypothetical protein
MTFQMGMRVPRVLIMASCVWRTFCYKRVKIHLTNVWCCGEFGDKHVVCLVLWRVRRQTRCMFGVDNTKHTTCLSPNSPQHQAYNVFVSELSTTPNIQGVCLRTLQQCIFWPKKTNAEYTS